MRHYQLSAGPRSKWDCPALLKSQMMRGVLCGLKEASVRLAATAQNMLCLCGPMPWTRSSGSSKRRMPVPKMSEKMQGQRCWQSERDKAAQRQRLVETSFAVVLEHVFHDPKRVSTGFIWWHPEFQEFNIVIVDSYSPWQTPGVTKFQLETTPTVQ